MHVHDLYKIAKIGFFGEYIYLCEDIKQPESEKQSIFITTCSNDVSHVFLVGMSSLRADQSDIW